MKFNTVAIQYNLVLIQIVLILLNYLYIVLIFNDKWYLHYKISDKKKIYTNVI